MIARSTFSRMCRRWNGVLAIALVIGTAHTVSRTDGSFRLSIAKPGAVVVSVNSDDVPPQQFNVKASSTAHMNLRVCSTTLDYNCGPPQ